MTNPMRNRQKKVSGFTLTEVLVVLVITVVVVGLCFSVLSIVRKELSEISKHQETQTNHNLFEERLTIDFQNSQKIFWNKDKNTISCFSPIKNTIYTFKNQIIYCKTDTLVQNLKSYTCFLNGKSLEKTGFLNAIRYTLKPETNSKEMDFFIFKPHDINSYFLENERIP